MRRPELVIPYCEDQIGSYFIQVRPDGTKHTLWISQCNTKALVKANIKSERRRSHAYQQWLDKRAAGKLPKTKTAPKSKPPPPPPVPFEDVLLMEETGYESSDDDYVEPTTTTFTELSSSDSDSGSDEEPAPRRRLPPVTKSIKIPNKRGSATPYHEKVVTTTPGPYA